MVKVSAPGKLMLFGDHAAVYAKPCIVTAVNHRMSVFVEEGTDDIIILEAPDVDIHDYKVGFDNLGGDHPKGAKFVLKAVQNFFEKYNVKKGLKINTKSEFSSLFGFGSSSAVTASTIKALSEIFKIEMSNKEIFDLSFKTILDIQGTGSGFDVAAATWGGTLYYVKPGKIIKQLKVDEIPLIVGYTGIKADTTTIVNAVKKEMDNNPEKINSIFNKMEEIVNNTESLFASGDWEKIGEFMDINQESLRELGVSTPELENLIKAAKNSGAYGAKLSGAGGGDCMIALGNEEVGKALEAAGGKVIKVKTNAEGIKMEG